MSIVDSYRPKFDSLCLLPRNRPGPPGSWPLGSCLSLWWKYPGKKTMGTLPATSLLVLAREARKAPRQIAEIIVRFFAKEGTWVKKIEVAGPGFSIFTWIQAGFYQVLPMLKNGMRTMEAVPSARAEGAGGVCQRQSHGLK